MWLFMWLFYAAVVYDVDVTIGGKMRQKPAVTFSGQLLWIPNNQKSYSYRWWTMYTWVGENLTLAKSDFYKIWLRRILTFSNFEFFEFWQFLNFTNPWFYENLTSQYYGGKIILENLSSIPKSAICFCYNLSWTFFLPTENQYETNLSLQVKLDHNDYHW